MSISRIVFSTRYAPCIFPELGMAVKAEWKSVVFDYILSKTFYFNQIYDKNVFK
jgi:hypothetical protein